MTTLGLSKVFILDKYFTELQKFWETERKLQDASSSNEAVHLQQRLRTLSTELVTLRNRLHVTSAGEGNGPPGTTLPPSAPLPPVVGRSIPVVLNQQNGGVCGNPGANGKAPALNLTDNFHQINNPHNGPVTKGNNEVNNNGGNINGNNLVEGGGGGKGNFDQGPVNNNNSNNNNCNHNNVNNRQVYTDDENCMESGLVVGETQPGNYQALFSTEVRDLIHLAGPLTEDALVRTLHARFAAGEHFTNVGPILLSVNPYHAVGNPLTLSSVIGVPPPIPPPSMGISRSSGVRGAPELLKVVHEAVRQQSETGYPQAIILSGESGSGKTYASMMLLRQLFDVAGGGPETDAFKHLAAAFTVLRSLGSAKTAANSESSRIGHFLEVQVTDGALYRTKIHCYFLDQSRVVNPLPKEKNYHIFYQLLAGLNPDERAKLCLEGYSIHNLRYLNRGDTSQNEVEDASRFDAWKSCLSVLGVCQFDVLRVLAAVLLLGNVQFKDGAGVEVDVKGGNELKSVASLLGLSSVALLRGLTTRTHNVRGQLVKSLADSNMANATRDALAKALYCRTVATIVRRANSLKRLGSTSGTLSSDSNDSVHNHTETSSQHASTVGSGGAKSSKSMTALNSAVRHATDGFIGILDMFGYEDSEPSQLEHLCINLCAETLQHFYNTHVFKASIEACREEGVQSEAEVGYVDNVPCIDLISSLRTGLLSMLDVECSLRGTPESYIQKVKNQHKTSRRYFEPKPFNQRQFGIRHFAGRVVYEASTFLDTNRDVVPDDAVAVFHKSSCNFGFASHLFGSELKALYSQETVPRGQSFRISPTAHTDLQNGGEPVSTLTQDFHTRLDNLLRTLVHAKPHFVRCIRANACEQPGHFDRSAVVRQIRALQVLETVNLMAGGFPHRVRFKAFSIRYRLLAPFKKLKRSEEKVQEDCKLILECFAQATQHWPKWSASTSWAFGKRHLFLSEGIRQQLEALRVERRHVAAVCVQALWRGWYFRCRRWPNLRRHLLLLNQQRPSHPNLHPPVHHNVPHPLPNTHHFPIPNHQGTLTRGNRLMENNTTSYGVNSNSLMMPPSRPPPAPSLLQHQQPAPCINQGMNLGNIPVPPTEQNLQGNQACPAGPDVPSIPPANSGVPGRPRPQPIAGTPPPEMERCDQRVVQQTCSLFGLDLERPPPVPPSRPYTVSGNTKLGYPQARVMKMNFPGDDPNAEEPLLRKSETVMVIGASAKRGHLLVEHRNGQTIDVPYQFLELMSPSGCGASFSSSPTGSVAAAAPVCQSMTSLPSQQGMTPSTSTNPVSPLPSNSQCPSSGNNGQGGGVNI